METKTSSKNATGVIAVIACIGMASVIGAIVFFVWNYIFVPGSPYLSAITFGKSFIIGIIVVIVLLFIFFANKR